MAGYVFGCPHCSAKLEARDASRAGRVITCPQCQQPLTIPPPPPMGVVLSAPGTPASAPPPPESQVQVSHDPGFKRGMSPAKAYSDGPSAPAASSSGFDKLAPAGPLETTPQHTIEAGEDVEGYTFTIPDEGEAEPKPRKLKKKKKSSEPETEVEGVHPLEDPKYQLLGLILLVGLIVGAISWWKSGDVKKKAELADDIAKAKAANEAPPPPAKPGELPGSTAGPEPAQPLAPAGQLPGTAPPAPNGQLPGGSPTPAADSSEAAPPAPGGLPGAAPGTLPGSSPEAAPKSEEAAPAKPAAVPSGALPGSAAEQAAEQPPPQ